MGEQVRKYLFPLLFVVVVVTVAYVWFVLQTATPTGNEILNHYASSIKFVRLALAFGYIVVWVSGAYALARLAAYRTTLWGSDDAKGFNKLFWGLAVLWVGFLAWPLFAALRGDLLQSPDLIKTLTFGYNAGLIYPLLIGFYYIFSGAKNLLTTISTKGRYQVMPLVLIALLVPVYLWALLSNPIRTTPPASGIPATFYLNDALIVLLIALPAVWSWVTGALAISCLRVFAQKSPGVIYRKALPSLNTGLASVILGNIALAGIVSIGTNALFSLPLAGQIALVYIFVSMIAIGFILIARATAKLIKIEEA